MRCLVALHLLAVLISALGSISIPETSLSRSVDTVSIRAASTQACNNYEELCNRKYSNITEICAHNSPFNILNDVASNQIYSVITQLNDGIRMLEGQTHMSNGTLHYCHTTCALLDAGPVELYFKDVADWLQDNPSEVVTILIANGDTSPVTDFVGPIQNSGLGKYVYTPPTVPMTLNLWPTLAELISDDHRIIIFMDYGADQSEVPYILDQYSQLWQTPISPTDASFPCTIGQPSSLSDQDARDILYLINHNLNTKLNISTIEILIPDLTDINRTNGEGGYGSLGLTVNDCAAMWGRPPNFLVVDYYNYGSPANGSVFEVAAQANGVTYTRSCCGMNTAISSPTGTGGTAAATTSGSTATTSGSSSTVTPSSSSASKKVNSWTACLLTIVAGFMGLYG